MSEANKKLVQRHFEELVRGNLAALDELVDDAFVSYDPTEPGPVRGRGAYRASAEPFLDAFPGMQVRIHDQFAAGDKVATRYTVSGRHEGELFGVPATGKNLEFTGIDIHRIKDGRILEEWASWDALGLMRQLGVVPEDAAS